MFGRHEPHKKTTSRKIIFYSTLTLSGRSADTHSGSTSSRLHPVGIQIGGPDLEYRYTDRWTRPRVYVYR